MAGQAGDAERHCHARGKNPLSQPPSRPADDEATELTIFSPASGELLETVATPDPAQISRAIRNCRSAQASWATQPATRRCEQLLKWRDALLHAGEHLALQLSRENGKPLHESWLHEVLPLCDMLAWLAGAAPAALSESEISLRLMKHQQSRVLAKPKGVCAVITPYNFPLLIPGSDAAAALAAGCGVIIKPSEKGTLTALLAVQLAHEAGLDPDLIQVLPGGAAVALQIIHAGVDEVVFTGSTAHGRSVAIACAEQLTPCTLELGGGASAVVFDSADVDRAADRIVFGALANLGQSCISIERVFVQARLQTKLVDALVDRVKRLRQGDPCHEDVDLGAMTSERQLEVVREHLANAVQQGAKAALMGTRLGRAGHFMGPSILANCNLQMDAFRRETFGPVIAIGPFDTPANALQIVQSIGPMLAAYMFGSRLQELAEWARQINAGHCLINDVLWSYVCPELPFGGSGTCGWGQVHGVEGLLSHTRRAHIGQRRFWLPQAMELGFPYRSVSLSLARRAMSVLTRWST